MSSPSTINTHDQDFDPAKILGQLTLDEKIQLLCGSDMWHTASIERLSIPAIRMSDGPMFVRGTKTFNSTPTNVFPCTSSMACSFDKDLMYEVGEALGRECIAKGAAVLLGPNVNLIRSPLGGRGFEMFSEDPFINGTLGAAFVNGVQSYKVGVSLKQMTDSASGLINNESETRRKTVSAEVSGRALREVYLKPFEMVQKQAKPLTFMTSYNRLNGIHCSEDKTLLDGILRKEWGFDGLVMSDWWGTYSTVEALEAGLDLEMPGPSATRAGLINFYINAGKLDNKVVDKRVLTVLRFVKECCKVGIPERREEGSIDTPKTRALLRRACAESIVLMKNDNKILPLSLSETKKIAVIGHHAILPYCTGGYPANPRPVRYITPFEGICAAVGDGVVVTHHIGAYSHKLLPLLGRMMKSPSTGGSEDGFDLSFYNEDPEKTNVEPANVWTFQESFCLVGTTRVPGVIKSPWMKLEGLFTPDREGEWEFGLVMIGQGYLYIDNQLVVDNWADQKPGQELFGFGTDEKRGIKYLEAGKTYRVTLKTKSLEDQTKPGPRTGFRLGAALVIDPEQEILDAVEAAKKADVAVVVVGLSSEYESEDFDRPHMRLPALQDRLVQAVLNARTDAIIVTQSGTPIEMPWVDDASTLVHLAYPGNEGGHALADVLFGKVNPSAKLTVTWPARIEDHPSFLSFPGENDKMIYTEDIFIGHRYFDAVKRAPLFPLGHGLSYTTFSATNLAIKQVGTGLKYTVSVSIENTGSTAGAEIALLYVGDVECCLRRPLREIKGFAKVHLEPGQAKRVEIELDREAFAYWDERAYKWVVEEGEFEVSVQMGVGVEPLKGTITVAKGYSWDP